MSKEDYIRVPEGALHAAWRNLEWFAIAGVAVWWSIGVLALPSIVGVVSLGIASLGGGAITLALMKRYRKRQKAVPEASEVP